MKLDKKIPYYGKYNSISNVTISEDGKNYLVRRYDDKGKIREEVFKTPNKPKNKQLLLKDYYHDIEEYLIKNKTKYEDIITSEKLLKKNISLDNIKKYTKIFSISTCLSAILVATSIYIPSAIILYYISSSMLVVSGVGTLLTTDLAKEVKKKNFVDNYNQFNKDLKTYQTSIENNNKQTHTSYKGLNNDKNKGNDLTIKKVRKKEEVA